jgi:hypothetical protein
MSPLLKWRKERSKPAWNRPKSRMARLMERVQRDIEASQERVEQVEVNSKAGAF